LFYTLMGLAIAVILHARGAKLRWLAILFFLVQLVANYAWSPLFFRFHMVPESLWLIVFIFVMAALTTILFARIRMIAAILMLPYLGWLVFAGILTLSIDTLNPNAANLVGPGLSTHI
jgi:tryptophan-rich sensory protein